MLSFAIELQAQAAKFLFYVVFFAIVFTHVSGLFCFLACSTGSSCSVSFLFAYDPHDDFILGFGLQYGMLINIFREVYISIQQLR